MCVKIFVSEYVRVCGRVCGGKMCESPVSKRGSECVKASCVWGSE